MAELKDYEFIMLRMKLVCIDYDIENNCDVGKDVWENLTEEIETFEKWQEYIKLRKMELSAIDKLGGVRKIQGLENFLKEVRDGK